MQLVAMPQSHSRHREVCATAVHRATTIHLDSTSSSTVPTKGAGRTMSSTRLSSQGRRKANADATAVVKMEQDSSSDEEEEVQQQQRRQAQGGRGITSSAGGANNDNDDDDDDDDDSSSSDEGPDSMPSKTKTLINSAKAASAAAAATAAGGGRGSKAQQQPSRQTGDVDSFGKRKADDFLRRQELAMDPRFKSTVVLPGDDVTDSTTRTTRSLRLGPGLVQKEEKVLATRAGMLRYRPPCSYWVESNGRRYGARAEDQVLGIVEDRMGESYKVNIFGSSAALLGMLEFDGASKRSKPNLKSGSLVFCRVATVNKHMETELTCTSTHHGSKKDWMTGQSTFGELRGGKMERCSLLLSKSLTKPSCRVLKSLAKHMPFEVAAGLNGAFWVDSGSEAHTIVICNAILNSEVMNDAQTDAMVDRLASHMKRALASADA